MKMRRPLTGDPSPEYRASIPNFQGFLPRYSNLVNMHGYHKVAEYMSSHGEVAILRRFTRLNLLNLLYLQADIMRLEHRLFEVVDENTNITSAKDWYALCNSPEDRDQVQLGLTLELQEKLDHFSAYTSHGYSNLLYCEQSESR
jgi:hypothetical protein